MIKAIIFDLDNCVFDTSSMGGGVVEPVYKVLFDSSLPEETKLAARAAMKTDALPVVLERFSIPAEIGNAMRAEYCNMVLPPERNAATYGDDHYIKNFAVLKFLVTTGYEKFQRSKIERVGIASLFDEVRIDIVDDPKNIKGKKRIFEEILAEYKLQKEEVLVVGDNPRSELQAAKELGIIAIQSLRPGVQKWGDADYHIESFSELAALIK